MNPAIILSQAALDVVVERKRQVEKEGHTFENDDEYNGGELALAAACYAIEGGTNLTLEDDERTPPEVWPWRSKRWKPAPDPRRNLVKAGALILAEIERLDRLTEAPRDEHDETLNTFDPDMGDR